MNNIEKQHNSKEIYIKQNDINKYIYNRNIPSNDIEPVFDPRPTPTKYETNRKITSNVNIKKYNNFDTNNTFYPGTKKPSFFGFSNNVDLETELLHNNNKYDVKNNGDLYNNNSNINNNNSYYSEINYSYLLKKPESNYINQNNLTSLGNETFYNNTRVQLKNIK